MINITASGSQKVADNGYGIMIQVNTGLTGTIVVSDARGTIATITNPIVGNNFTYYGTQGQVNVNPSAAVDLTVSVLSHQV
jgi:hypothetical protein